MRIKPKTNHLDTGLKLSAAATLLQEPRAIRPRCAAVSHTSGVYLEKGAFTEALTVYETAAEHDSCSVAIKGSQGTPTSEANKRAREIAIPLKAGRQDR